MTWKWIELLVVVQDLDSHFGSTSTSYLNISRMYCTVLPVYLCVFDVSRMDVELAPFPPPVLLPPSQPPSSCYSLCAAEGRQRSLHALDCLLHCLSCFPVSVLHSLPIFVFINHNGCLLWVSWWLFFKGCLLFSCTGFCFSAPAFCFNASVIVHAVRVEQPPNERQVGRESMCKFTSSR